MAIEAGADLVLALPYIYSVNSAREYARGAVGILAASGAADFISFGCETDDPDLLERAAGASADEDRLSPIIKSGLAAGMSFPAAFTGAVESAYGPEVAGVLRSPNNLLACEYMNALSDLGPPMKPVPVKRAENGAAAPDGGRYVSASEIRKIAVSEGAAAADRLLPESSARLLSGCFADTAPGQARRRAEDAAVKLLRYRAFTSDAEDIGAVYSAAEGIENRFMASVLDEKLDTPGRIADTIKTKRYTRARIMRLLTHIMMNFKSEDFEWLRGASCARVLAAGPRGREILRRMRKTSSIPVISNLSRPDRYDARVRRILELDIRASRLYDMLVGGTDPMREIKYVPYMNII